MVLLLGETGRQALAEPLLRRALAIDERAYGPNNPFVAIDLDFLGLLLKSAALTREAESLLRRAVVIHERAYGPAHPDVATSLENLATVLGSTNRLAQGGTAHGSLRDHLLAVSTGGRLRRSKVTHRNQ